MGKYGKTKLPILRVRIENFVRKHEEIESKISNEVLQLVKEHVALKSLSARTNPIVLHEDAVRFRKALYYDKCLP